MWTKLWETIDGHDSGRWQWFMDAEHNTRPSEEVALRARITDGRLGWVYPGVWMFGDAICPPPGVGRCITDKEKVQKDQMRMSMR